MPLLTLQRLCSMLLVMLLLAGCSSKQEELQAQINAQTTFTEQKVQKLSELLNNDQLKNAGIIRAYASQLAEQRPELKTLTDQLALEATDQGAMYLGLKKRLAKVKSSPEEFVDKNEILAELKSIEEAASANLYNDVLSDTVNVLADLSQGSLSRVNSISKKSEQAMYGTVQPGAQLVGNPAYGEWSTGSGGSFWQWYGIYRLMDDLFDVDRRRYSSWSSRRGYSYYHDYGRSRYTSPKSMRSQNDIQRKTQKQFQRDGKKFNSPYAKRRVGGSSLSRASHSPSRASKYSNRSSYSSGKTSSSYSRSSKASVRNSNSRTTRSRFRGK